MKAKEEAYLVVAVQLDNTSATLEIRYLSTRPTSLVVLQRSARFQQPRINLLLQCTAVAGRDLDCKPVGLAVLGLWLRTCAGLGFRRVPGVARADQNLVGD